MSNGIGEPPAPPGVATPSLTIHALDLTRGLPAIGPGVEVLSDEGHSRSSIETNNDGRTDQPLLEGSSFASGQYTLRFVIGKHFASDAAVDVGHLHVVMLMPPYSYTVYRGS